DAGTLADRAVTIYRPLVEQNPSIVRFIIELAGALIYSAQAAEESGDAEAARARRLQALDFLHVQLPLDDPTRLASRLVGDDTELFPNALADFTRTLIRKGRFADAEPFAREYVAIAELKFSKDWRTFSARSMLGSILLEQKQYGKAESSLLSACEG